MKNQSSKKIGALVLGLVAVGSILAAGPRVEREGDAAHRQAINEIETKPFAVELFAGLDHWTLENAMDSESIEGKVVLVGFLSSGDPLSMKSIASLSRYHRKYADKGLVVLAVHPELGWEAFDEKIAAGRVRVPAARDAGGLLAAGLLADGYPDLYLIDRAGQLRYADFENRSLKGAVAQLLRETPEEANTQAATQSQEADEPEFEEEVVEVVVEDEPTKKEISPAMYAQANWPELNTGNLYGKDFQGRELPVALGSEKWLSEEKDIEGKVILIDFWATWCGPCKQASPLFDALQKQFEGKLEVLAISGQRENEQTVRQYINNHKVSYSHLFDSNQQIYRALQVTGIPHVVVMSSDGVIRWQGFPQGRPFIEAIRQIIEVDPMFAED